MSTADNIAVMNEVYNGQPINSTTWWETRWAEDSVFEVGPDVTLPKVVFVAVHQSVVKAFPGFYFKVIEAPSANEDGSITVVLQAHGKHTGEPFTPKPDLKAIEAAGVEVMNDPEKVTVYFNGEGKIVRQTIEALPGGKGFGGPVGFYLQIGGTMS